ncbi:MAG TPA: hypothetical protein VFA87_00865, partial [Rhizomicrobium sp.]|nr:hypothetical protein [Rhizomicrobium sp.]
MYVARLLGMSALSIFLLGARAQAQTVSSPQLRQLHDALNLRADQDASWQDYARSTAIEPEELTARREAS